MNIMEYSRHYVCKSVYQNFNYHGAFNSLGVLNNHAALHRFRRCLAKFRREQAILEFLSNAESFEQAKLYSVNNLPEPEFLIFLSIFTFSCTGF
uniref:Uncharacterized protein n=1 Tax=Triticum urartu TaxID=4572 RepID=A0A8R7TWT2_TRIUA